MILPDDLYGTNELVCKSGARHAISMIIFNCEIIVMVGYWSATVPQWALSLCLYYRPTSVVLIYTCITCSYPYHSIRRPLGIITSCRAMVRGRTVRASICIQVNISIYGRCASRLPPAAMLPRCIEFGTNGLDSHYQFTFTCYCDSRLITISPTVQD